VRRMGWDDCLLYALGDSAMLCGCAGEPLSMPFEALEKLRWW